MRLQEAIALLKSEGYRVTKPKPKATGKKGRVGPTFVAVFADGETTRMSTFTSLAALDLGRGVRLANAAWQSRHRRKRWPVALRDAVMRMQWCSIMSPDRLAAFVERKHNAPPPRIVAAHFEQDDVTLASYAPDQLEAVG